MCCKLNSSLTNEPILLKLNIVSSKGPEDVHEGIPAHTVSREIIGSARRGYPFKEYQSINETTMKSNGEILLTFLHFRKLE